MPPAVLMVAPAWRLPHLSSLALGTLCPILRASGIEVDELHGSLPFPQPASPFAILENYSRYLFVPSLTGCDVEQLLDEVIHDALDEANLKGVLVPPERVSGLTLGIDEQGLRQSF